MRDEFKIRTNFDFLQQFAWQTWPEAWRIIGFNCGQQLDLGKATRIWTAAQKYLER